MKVLPLIIMAGLVAVGVVSCTAQRKKDKQLIRSFFEAAADSAVTFEGLQQWGILYISDKYRNMQDADRAELDSVYTIVIKAIYRKLDSVCGNKEPEILTLRESRSKKHYKGDFAILGGGGHYYRIYVVFCGSTVISRLLVRRNRIASFIALHKGGGFGMFMLL